MGWTLLHGFPFKTSRLYASHKIQQVSRLHYQSTHCLTSRTLNLLGKIEADFNPVCPPTMENTYQALQMVPLKSPALEAGTPL